MPPRSAQHDLPLQSCIYKGLVWHRRTKPKVHQFNYRVFMMYLSLDELDALLARSRFWGKRWYHLARFKREDFYGDANRCVSDCVKEKIQNDLGFTPTGSVRLLANIRYFGYITNPISCYYCYDLHDNLVAQLLEVTNTPWGEKHDYVVDLRDQTDSDRVEVSFHKQMHVSPFMPMNIKYQWRGLKPGERLEFSLSNWLKPPVAAGSMNDEESKEKASPIFAAGVSFSRIEISKSSLKEILLIYPMMTLKVLVGIYWQALRLFIKRINIFPHPSKIKAPRGDSKIQTGVNIESKIEGNLKVRQSKT